MAADQIVVRFVVPDRLLGHPGEFRRSLDAAVLEIEGAIDDGIREPIWESFAIEAAHVDSISAVEFRVGMLARRTR